MALLDTLRKLQSGFQEVKEGLPLARTGLKDFNRSIQIKKREPDRVDPNFLERSTIEQVFSPEVSREAQRRTGNIFASVASLLKAPESEEEVRKQGLVGIPGTSLSFDVFGAIGSTSGPARKAIRTGVSKVSKELKSARAFKGNLNIQKATNLFPEDVVVEARFAKQLQTKVNSSIKQYRENFGKIINTDNARELSRDYAPGGINSLDQITKDARSLKSAAVHEPASALSKEIYRQDLVAKAGQGNNTVFFTAGGTGSGKSFAIKNVEAIQGVADRAPIIYDTNLATFNSSVSKIDDAIKNGYKVVVAYVHRTPEESFLNGVLPRARDFGRTVPIEEHLKTSFGSPKTVLELQKHYRGSSDVRFRFIDNTRSVDEIQETTMDIVKNLRYNESGIRSNLFNILENEHNTGRVSEVIYRGTKQSTTGRPSGLVRGRDGGQLKRKPPKTRERGFITSTKEQFPEIKIAGQYIPRSTDNLSIKARNLIRDDIATAERMAREGTDDRSVAVSSELLKHYGEEAKKAKGPAQQALYDKAAEIAVISARNLTEQGRAVQAASILGRQTPEGQLRFAAKLIEDYNEGISKIRGGILGLKKKVPELTGEQSKRISDEMDRIINMEDGIDKAIAFQKLQDEIGSLIPSPWYAKAIALWKAGLLTGVKTTGLNTFSNLFHGVSEIVKDVPAVAIDNVASIFTKRRTLAFTTRGIVSGGKEGLEKGIRYMKTGFDERNIAAKLDWKKVNFGKNRYARAIQTYEETIFHLMGAEDQPFYYGAKARSMASQAMAEAKNAGIKLKSKEGREFVQNLIENPTDDMLRYATRDATVAVFQNRTKLGEVGKAFQDIPGGEIVVPFSRTPSAVIMQTINYSPIGVANTIITNIGRGRFDQRLFSQGLGRGLIGTAVVAIGMALFNKGMMTLDFPKTQRERRQWELEGRKANSIKINGKWRSPMVLGPLGIVLLYGGQFQNAIDDTGSWSKALPQATFGSLKSFQEQTFLRGINEFSKAINEPERSALSVTSRLVGSLIPTFVSDIARATDPIKRRTRATQEGFLAPLQSRVPGARRGLEPRIGALGEPVERVGGAIETMIDPTRPSREQSSALITELRRLLDLDLSATPTYFGDDKRTLEVLTAEQRTYLQQKAGQIVAGKLESLIQMTQYQALEDEEKMKNIKEITDEGRVVARAELVQELLIDLDETERLEMLSKMKTSGFLTKQVFKKWDELFGQ